MSIAAVSGADARAKYSDDEWRVRLDLAACYRLVQHYGLSDLIYNHITAAVPGAEGQVLINPYGLRYDEVTASNLIRIDLAGNILEETPHEINPAGYVIHSAVHAARPDVKCVLHTHSRAGCAVSAMKRGLLPLDQQSMQFYNRVAYHDFNGFALDDEEKQLLVANLGGKRAMILRNHGLLVAAGSVSEAFRLIFYLERACQLQLDVLQTGEALHLPPDDICEHTARQWESGAAGIGVGETREWPALLRMLEADDPSFMT